MIVSEEKHDGRVIYRRVVSAFFERVAVNFVDDLRGLGNCHQQAFRTYANKCIACAGCFPYTYSLISWLPP